MKSPWDAVSMLFVHNMRRMSCATSMAQVESLQGPCSLPVASRLARQDIFESLWIPSLWKTNWGFWSFSKSLGKSAEYVIKTHISKPTQLYTFLNEIRHNVLSQRSFYIESYSAVPQACINLPLGPGAERFLRPPERWSNNEDVSIIIVGRLWPWCQVATGPSYH